VGQKNWFGYAGLAQAVRVEVVVDVHLLEVAVVIVELVHDTENRVLARLAFGAKLGHAGTRI
jgi:hypothetical protein